MMLDLSLPSMSSFLTTLALLLVYSVLDLRERRVSNSIMLAGGVIGFGIVVISGHLIQSLLLHVVGPIFVVLVALVLFRVGAIGGADFKAILTVSIISPGVEFAAWGDQILEAIVGGGLSLLIMLLIGYCYSSYRIRRTHLQRDNRVTPLIPFLLISYLLIQTLAFL